MIVTEQYKLEQELKSLREDYRKVMIVVQEGLEEIKQLVREADEAWKQYKNLKEKIDKRIVQEKDTTGE